MAWESTAPAIIGQLRTQLALCTSWAAAISPALSADRVHFPNFNPGGTRATVDALPAILLQRPQASRRKWVEGSGGLINGSLGMLFYFPALTVGLVAGYSSGQVEALVETILGELLAQQSGIPFRDDFTLGEASEPTDPEIASDTAAAPSAFRTCQATLPYGYSP